MRILHVATRHLRGGAERNLLHTVQWQRGRGYEVELAFGGSSTPVDVPADVPVHVLPWLQREISPVADARTVSALARLVRKGRFDVIHTHQSKAGILGRLAAGGGRRIVVHTVHMPSFGPEYGPARSSAFRAAERVCARFTDVFVGVGDEVRERYLKAGIGHPRTFLVVRSPVDVETFARVRALTPEERRRVRSMLGVGAAMPVIAAVGSLEPRKRFELALTELAPLLRGGMATLLIAGDGCSRRSLEARAAELEVADHVVFAGHVEGVVRVFAAADVLVHASRVEGVPQVVIQALAASVPVVATDSIGLREVRGAPITIVPTSGSGLLTAASSIISKPPPPVDLGLLDEWRPESVERSLQDLDERLVALARR